MREIRRILAEGKRGEGRGKGGEERERRETNRGEIERKRRGKEGMRDKKRHEE